jgi:3-deoxy-manno-octulosonate cytidylyltransferase (CMP-KDO synthetase)
MNTVIIIPARFESSRLPGKPLIKLNGIPMIIRTCMSCESSFGKESVYVATDDIRIEKMCMEYGYNVILTSSDCLTGTDRVAEASKKFSDDTYIINVQGDEPMITESVISNLYEYSKLNKYTITCKTKIYEEDEFRNPNIVKVVTGDDSSLLFASRSPIPTTKNKNFINAYKHVPIYGFLKKDLDEFYRLGMYRKSTLENIEDVEMLRFIEHGICIKCINVEYDGVSVDTPDDIIKIEKIL